MAKAAAQSSSLTQPVVCPLKLVRPGMAIPARLPRAALNPSIPPANAAAAAAATAVGGQPMTQQVFIPGLTFDPSLVRLV